MIYSDYQIVIEQTSADLKKTCEALVNCGWIPVGDITAVHNPHHGMTEFLLQMGKIDPATVVLAP